MPSWNAIYDSIQPINALEKLKKQYFRSYIGYTKRNCIVYFSSWQQKPTIPGNTAIDDDDRNGFMNALHTIDKRKGLDLILHTPGGDLAATQAIVDYLYNFFNGDIRVIVPHTAMSAGTMLACSAKEIIMGKHSNLGPIDPQIGNMPAHEYINLLDKAIKDINNGQNIQYWQMTLKNYPPTFFGVCNNAIAVSKKLVRSWLSRSMLKDANPEEIERTVNYLADYKTHLQHNARLSINELSANTSLKIVSLESDQKLQDYVLSLYHCYQMMASMTNCIKIIENHKSIKFIKNHM